MQRSLINFYAVFILLMIITVMFVLFIPHQSFAQTVADENTSAFAQSAGIETETSLVTIIGNIVRVLLALLGILLILLIMYGGWIWMQSQGDPAKVDKGKKIITNAIIGVIIISLAFAITTFVMGILNGTFGGGGRGRGPVIPGGYNDWNRSMIGKGPIESVYPTPNQKDVFIDTLVVVTFKQEIQADTIYGANDKIVSDNIEICQVNAETYDCVETDDFKIEAFNDTTVTSTIDNRTFVFYPNKPLGLNDGLKRIFKVKLKNGIKNISGDNIFKGGYYEWVFETNGKLDWNPPKLLLREIYPVPDDYADEYGDLADPNAGTASITMTIADITPELPQRIATSSNLLLYRGQPLSLPITHGDTGQILYLKTDTGFEFKTSTLTNVSVNIVSNGTQATVSSPDLFGLAESSLPLTDTQTQLSFKNGLYLQTSGGPFQKGLTWQFWVAGNRDGKTFIIKNGNQEYRYLFVDQTYDTRSTLSKNNVSYHTVLVPTNSSLTNSVSALVDKINATAGEVVVASSSEGTLNLTAKYAGSASQNIEVGTSTNSLTKLLGGTDTFKGRSLVRGAFDPYNNSLFQFTFDKAINPVTIEGTIIVKYDTNGDGVLDGTVQASSSISNQYRTITLRPPNVCGVNTCGDPIYCWMEVAPENPTSTKFEIEIIPAPLRTCNSNWCGSGDSSVGFGGSCETGTTNRCFKTVDEKNAFYPKAEGTSGISDLSNNSFNGNFNEYVDVNGKTLGIAEGPSTSTCASTAGCSGMSPYVLTTTTNVVAGTNTGDNVKWSFYLSSEVDTKSPLINRIFPVGNQDYGIIEEELSNREVEVEFDRLMDSSSFKPGWGYGTSTGSTYSKNWYQRYFVLQTLNKGANPIGYWISKTESHVNGDNVPDRTIALIKHNNFDNAVQYGPLIGSGAKSITQNCFMPGGGPRYAGADGDFNTVTSSNNCIYTSNANNNLNTDGCVNDSIIAEQYRVFSDNPASYAHMKCDQIEGAEVCDNTETCKPFYSAGDNMAGSWIISSDYGTSTGNERRTGCCFGKCE